MPPEPLSDPRPLTPDPLVMGTRGSPLALAQSRQTARALERAHPGLRVEERVIRTTGDKQRNAPLPEIGGKGVFTLEIEQALLKGDIDFAVHSLKDLPPQLPPGLCIGAVPKRESPNDVCVLRAKLEAGSAASSSSSSESLPFLPQEARVGTSSLRRRAQLLHLRPDLQIEDIRGNIDTRLRKMEEGAFAAIVLAEAGLHRLGLLASGAAALYQLGAEFLPAPGQGALAIEARAGDEKILSILGRIEDAATRAEVSAERAVVRHLNAGCSTPLGALARVEMHNGTLTLLAQVLSPNGRKRIVAEASGGLEAAETWGQTVAEKLLQQGARELLGAAKP